MIFLVYGFFSGNPFTRPHICGVNVYLYVVVLIVAECVGRAGEVVVDVFIFPAVGLVLPDFNLVGCDRHSCRLAWEVVQGCVLLGGVDAFVVALFDDFDNLVVVGLFGLQVYAQKFC